MKRLRRIILSALTAMSLVLCMATVGLWVRSHFANDWLGRVNYTPGIPSEDHHLWLSANLGMFEVVGGGDPAHSIVGCSDQSKSGASTVARRQSREYRRRHRAGDRSLWRLHR